MVYPLLRNPKVPYRKLVINIDLMTQCDCFTLHMERNVYVIYVWDIFYCSFLYNKLINELSLIVLGDL